MYSFIYFLISLMGIFYVFNNKDNHFHQNFYSLILSNFLILFFLSNNISADKSYYDFIYRNDYFAGFRSQGYDYLFYYFAHIISLFKSPKLANLFIYCSLIYSVYFFSNKFKNPFHIILLFFPIIFVVVMQGYPRQALALLFVIIGCNLLFYLDKNYKNGFSNRILINFFIFCFFLLSVFFHYSAAIFPILYIIFLLTKLRYKYIFLSSILIIFIFFILFISNYLDVYLIKFFQLKEFLSTRNDYSSKGFILRSVIIILPSILILYYFIKNLNNNKITFYSVDKFFFIFSIIYLLHLLVFLFNFNLILILDRLNLFFYLISIYFFGRFIFFYFFKKIYKSFILFSIIYLNIYLLFWTFFSDSYYEFKYKFGLFYSYSNVKLLNELYPIFGLS